MKGLNCLRPHCLSKTPQTSSTGMLYRRKAFTLVEVLVVIAITGVLVGLLAPSIQAIRESSRRTLCSSQLSSIGMAIHSYHDRWQTFPVGTVAEAGPVQSQATGNHHNWIGRLMELLDQPVIASRIDRSASVYDANNSAVLQLGYPGVKCPSSMKYQSNASSYVGIHHFAEKQIDESDRGVFILNVPISRDDISDGLANTAFVSEKLLHADDLGWLSGTRATLRNVGGGIETTVNPLIQHPPTAVGSIGSRHPAGVHVLFGSGEVRFETTHTDQRVLVQMADRSDGQLPMIFQSIDDLRRQSVQ